MSKGFPRIHPTSIHPWPCISPFNFLASSFAGRCCRLTLKRWCRLESEIAPFDSLKLETVAKIWRTDLAHPFPSIVKVSFVQVGDLYLFEATCVWLVLRKPGPTLKATPKIRVCPNFENDLVPVWTKPTLQPFLASASDAKSPVRPFDREAVVQWHSLSLFLLGSPVKTISLCLVKPQKGPSSRVPL